MIVITSSHAGGLPAQELCSNQLQQGNAEGAVGLA